MKITNEFTVHTPIERAWAVLTDLVGIAPCLPGAQLTGVDGDIFSGRVKVKVGPVISDFVGTARFVEKDDAARRAVIDAKGRDARSAGNAAAVVTARLRADGDRTLVNVDTDLKISGKLAQFGSGMIKEVSAKLLGQFVTNLEAKLAAEPTAAGSPGHSATSGDLGDPETAFDVAASASAVNGTAVRIVPGQNSSLPAGAPSAAGPGGLGVVAGAAAGGAAAGETGTTVQGDGGASGESVRVPDHRADEPETLDLLALAGGSVFKRAIPLGIGVVVVAGVIVWFVARR